MAFKSNNESKNKSLIFDSINKNPTNFLSSSSNNIINFGNEFFLFKNNNKIDKLLSSTKIYIFFIKVFMILNPNSVNLFDNIIEEYQLS